ncbi:MAG: indole-3-glycerol phosphate synthase TrpC [Flavobacteriales bacterium]
MDILEKIVLHKKKEVTLLKQQFSTKDFENSLYFERKTFSLQKRIQDPNSHGIIAEFKRKSPSKGVINDFSKPEDVIPLYKEAGVAGVSILTDFNFFGGSVDDVLSVRPLVDIPILRKEFIVDEFQIIQAKAIGADAILLIAECLTKEEVAAFSKCAQSLYLEVLLEIHSEKMLDKINNHLNIIGVNNRNLKTFKVNITQSLELFSKIPIKFAKISESGVSDLSEIRTLQKVGFDGFLIGENFMKTQNPGEACINFIKNI